MTHRDRESVWSEPKVTWTWHQYLGEDVYTVARKVQTDYAKFPTQAAATAFIAAQEAKDKAAK